MPTLHVCPLSRLPDVLRETQASHLISLLTATTAVERPPDIPQDRHLFIGMSDIVEAADGHVLPGREHVESLLDFVTRWERERPLVIHCWAGISRSTAAAYIAACALSRAGSEEAIARALRQASPMATPNRRLVSVADEVLDRKGRMIEAVGAIGRGADALEGVPFSLSLPER